MILRLKKVNFCTSGVSENCCLESQCKRPDVSLFRIDEHMFMGRCASDGDCCYDSTTRYIWVGGKGR